MAESNKYISQYRDGNDQVWLLKDREARTSLANKVNSSTFTAHTGDKNNPHGVTCEQIGALGLDALHLCEFVSDTEYPDLF